MSREAMTLALEALESAHPRFGIATERHQQAITALRAALDAYDQTALELCETCGWKAIVPGDGCLVCARQKPVAYADSIEQDTRPIWFGLTTQEILDIVDDHTERVGGLPMLYRDQAADLSRAIEARLKEKNT